MFDLEFGYFDIEVFCHTHAPIAEQDPITCLCISDGTEYVSYIVDDFDVTTSEGNWAVIHCSSEKMLLKQFTELLEERNYDVLTGWNVSFDKEYLEKRCWKHNLRLPISGSCIFDLWQAYKALYRRKSYRLKDIALYEGFTDKEEEKVDYGLMWEEDKPGLLERNRRHVQWLVDIDQKRRVLSYYWELREVCGLEGLDDTFYSTVMIDTLLLRDTKWVLPSKMKREHETYEGAFIMQPIAGIYQNVAAFDLTRFYPSIILSEKLDPIILHRYRQQYPGDIDWAQYKRFATGYLKSGGQTLMFDMVNRLVEKRKQLQAAGHKEKLAAIKGVLNSAYGAFGHAGFRLYVREIPERITEVARNTIQQIATEVTDWGYRVLYADTDSNFIQVEPDELPSLTDKLSAYVASLGDYEIKLDHYFESIMFTTAKKRYAGLENGEVHTTGLDRVRSDSSEYTKEVQDTIIHMMLTDKVEQIIPYLQQMVRIIKTRGLDEIAITKSLGRELSEYDKGVQDYIKSARNLKLDVRKGDALNIVHARNYAFGVAVYQDVADLPHRIEVDWKKIIDKQIRMKVEDLLPICGLSWEEVQGQRRLF